MFVLVAIATVLVGSSTLVHGFGESFKTKILQSGKLTNTPDFLKKNSHILFCLSQCNGNSADVWKILAFPALSLVRKSTLNACGDRLVVFMVSKPVFSAELHQLFKLGA